MVSTLGCDPDSRDSNSLGHPKVTYYSDLVQWQNACFVIKMSGVQIPQSERNTFVAQFGQSNRLITDRSLVQFQPKVRNHLNLEDAMSSLNAVMESRVERWTDYRLVLNEWWSCTGISVDIGQALILVTRQCSICSTTNRMVANSVQIMGSHAVKSGWMSKFQCGNRIFETVFLEDRSWKENFQLGGWTQSSSKMRVWCNWLACNFAKVTMWVQVPLPAR